MNTIKVSGPMSGAPAQFESPLQKRIYTLLQSLHIDYQRTENDPAVTMDDCNAIDNAFGVETIKTLLLTNRQKTCFYLLAMPAHKPFVTKDFGAALNIPRVSFADTQLLEQLLATPRGAATPLSIVNDTDNRVAMVIDSDLLERKTIVCPDGTLHGFIAINLAALLDIYLPHTGHTPQVIRL